MKNTKPIFVCVFLIALIVMLPVCFADELRATEGATLTKNNDSSKDQKNSNVASATDAFPGLVAWLVALISPFVSYIAIGAAVIVVGYFIYRIGYSTWVYYKAYSYSTWKDHHAYKEHIVDSYDFANIWGSKKPSQKTFEDKCKATINSKSVQRYVQKSNGANIVFDSATRMLVIGLADGKTIDTCYKTDQSYVNRKVNNGLWKKI